MESTKRKAGSIGDGWVLSKKDTLFCTLVQSDRRDVVVASDDVKDFMSQAELIHLLVTRCPAT